MIAFELLFACTAPQLPVQVDAQRADGRTTIHVHTAATHDDTYAPSGGTLEGLQITDEHGTIHEPMSIGPGEEGLTVVLPTDGVDRVRVSGVYVLDERRGRFDQRVVVSGPAR